MHNNKKNIKAIVRNIKFMQNKQVRNFTIICNFRVKTNGHTTQAINSHYANGKPSQAEIDEQQLLLDKKLEERLKQPLDYYYKMDNKNRGLALIFNHEVFVDTGLGVRRGTQVDCDRLQKTFTALNFDVRITNNPTEVEIRSILKKGKFSMIYKFYMNFSNSHIN